MTKLLTFSDGCPVLMSSVLDAVAEGKHARTLEELRVALRKIVAYAEGVIVLTTWQSEQNTKETEND